MLTTTSPHQSPKDDSLAQSLVTSFLFRAQAVFWGRLCFGLLYSGYLILQVYSLGIKPAHLMLDAIFIALSLAGAGLSFGLRHHPELGRKMHFASLIGDLLLHIFLLRHQNYLLSPLMAVHPLLTAAFLLLFHNPGLILVPLATLPLATALTGLYAPHFSAFQLILKIMIYGVLDFVVIFFVHQSQAKELQYVNSLMVLEKKLKSFAVSHERQRLAREFHDGVGTNLTSIAMLCEVMETKGLNLSEIKKIAREAILDMRRSISFLNDEFDICEQIEIISRNFKERHQLHIVIENLEPLTKIAPKSQIAVCRILQEALTNITKHAQASEVVISANMTGKDIHFFIKDNGLGFDVTRHQPHHYGIRNMKNRALQEGAELLVISEPNRGCTLKLGLTCQPNA
jgi:signal transduction histidine kinase